MFLKIYYFTIVSIFDSITQYNKKIYESFI